MRKKSLKNLNTSHLLEHLMAILVLIGIIIATFSLKDSFLKFWQCRNVDGSLLEYIGSIFNIVIGIEFFKLLWKPGKETLLEVLMFVIARHMIIEHTTALENLVSVIAIGVLFIVERYFLHTSKEAPDEEHTLFDR